MLIKLLEKWQTLEPHVCRYGSGVFRDSFFIRVSWGDWISISSTSPDPFFLDCTSAAKLQVYLQSKLDLFQWNWSVGKLPNSYMAVVDVPRQKVISSRQPSLIVALLDAYLQALESGKSLLLKKKEVSNGA
jgi:hypothetical protein